MIIDALFWIRIVVLVAIIIIAVILLFRWPIKRDPDFEWEIRYGKNLDPLGRMLQFMRDDHRKRNSEGNKRLVISLVAIEWWLILIFLFIMTIKR